MYYPLTADSWGDEEREAIDEVIKSGNYTAGEKTRKFEKEFASWHHPSGHAVMVNSGSSANLLAASLLKYRYRTTKTPNVIVPYLGWSTTYAPFAQLGFKLKFVDIIPDQLTIDPNLIEHAIDDDTAAVVTVNPLGNVCDYKKIRDMCDTNRILLIEDNCESFGAKLDGQYAGTFGDISTFSFFYSHHIQTMEGGMVMCKSKTDRQWLQSMRAHGWARDTTIFGNTEDDFAEAFRFVVPGYSVRPLEIEAAIGSIQLKKAPEMLEVRRRNAEKYTNLFSDFRNIDIIKPSAGVNSSWFGFPLIFKDWHTRERALCALKKIKVETRPLLSGNFSTSAAASYYDIENFTSSRNVDYIETRGLMIGNHPYYLDEQLCEVHEALYNAFEK